MRYILLLVTVAIIYIVFTRMVSTTHEENHEVTQALNAASQTANPANPGAPGAAAAPGQQHTDSLKAPLDRTRQVLEQVRKQKSDDQF
ncbi:MAG TPA: hypothetical protein VG733_11300 [Chthoniobacteraceae bacterium]|nr:hypothetical protein [Chthoniobacteraceae bacterium]